MNRSKIHTILLWIKPNIYADLLISVAINHLPRVPLHRRQHRHEWECMVDWSQHTATYIHDVVVDFSSPRWARPHNINALRAHVSGFCVQHSHPIAAVIRINIMLTTSTARKKAPGRQLLMRQRLFPLTHARVSTTATPRRCDSMWPGRRRRQPSDYLLRARARVRGFCWRLEWECCRMLRWACVYVAGFYPWPFRVCFALSLSGCWSCAIMRPAAGMSVLDSDGITCKC